jgi:hypothetical protein
MQALRIAMLLSGGLLLALTGCKGNQPAQPAPAVQVTPAAGANSTVRLRLKGTAWQVHHTASTGDTVTWKSPDSPFSVTFDPGANPCQPAGGSTPNTYSSSTGSAPYVATCNVTSTQSGQTYSYQVDTQKLIIGPSKDSVTPCSGCFLEVD